MYDIATEVITVPYTKDAITMAVVYISGIRNRTACHLFGSTRSIATRACTSLLILCIIHNNNTTLISMLLTTCTYIRTRACLRAQLMYLYMVLLNKIPAGGRKSFLKPGGVITWHRAVECLVSVSHCVIYIIPMIILSYKYGDVLVACCD